MYPPLRIFWFQGHASEEGVEEHDMDGIRVRIYSPEKTLADCFKYCNKIGPDVVLEAPSFKRHYPFLVHFAPGPRLTPTTLFPFCFVS
jgi:hypothetical protein